MSALITNTGLLGEDPTDDKTGGRFERLIVRVVTALLASLGYTVALSKTLTGTSGSKTHTQTDVTVNQSATAGYIAWLLNVTQTAVGSGVKLLMDLRVGGASKFKVDNTGLATAQAGLVATTGGVTATAGNVTATNGDIVASTAGKGVSIKEGTNGRLGQATLVAGTVTVANTTVTANTRIHYSRKTLGGTVGNLSYTLSAGVGFTLNSSSNTETSVLDYQLIEPA